MAAKKQIEAERIVQAACEIVEERGMDALNVRDVAARCECSTQPIYLCFGGLGALKREVCERIRGCYDEYIAAEIGSGRYPEYKASGMGYIRFAKERPNYFKYMFMRDTTADSVEADEIRFRREAERAMSYGIDEEAAIRMHTHMWVYVHGIATMYATGYLDWEWETVSNLLTEEFFAIKEKLFGGDNGNRD